MTETLKQRIIRHIELSGPLPLAEYMHWCMADREQGYYQTREAIGRDGDFITAPEVSQMFGELIGIWAMKTWDDLGRPNPFNLVELGPGKGTLMSDLLRASKAMPEMLAAARIHMVETSESLTAIQQKTLEGYEHSHWHRQLNIIPDGPLILVANEFLDVIPFRQYVKSDGNWHERCIGIDDNGNLSWILGASQIDISLLPEAANDEPEGSVKEISSAREAFFRKAADRISDQGGAALFIDYGYAESGFGDTLQAIRNHEYADPLDEPGLADLTSHVDFAALADCVTDVDVTCHPLVTQSEFLLSTGLLERAGQLGSGKDIKTQELLTRQAERLALPTEMGGLFKVMAISSLKSLWPFDKED